MISEHKISLIPHLEPTQLVQPATFSYHTTVAIINVHGLQFVNRIAHLLIAFLYVWQYERSYALVVTSKNRQNSRFI
jgi:hypothetical protein